MILCVYCGNEMEDEATVCPSCGKEVEPLEDQAALETEAQAAQEDIDNTGNALQEKKGQADEQAVDAITSVEDGEAKPAQEQEPEIAVDAEEAKAAEGAEEAMPDAGPAIETETGPVIAENSETAVVEETAVPDGEPVTVETAAVASGDTEEEIEPTEKTVEQRAEDPVKNTEPEEDGEINEPEGEAEEQDETDVIKPEEDAIEPEEDGQPSDIEAAADMAIHLDEPVVRKKEHEPVEGGASMSLARAVGALVCGIAGVIFCLVPVAGLVLSIVAMVLGAKARANSVHQRRGMAVAGFVLGVVGLVISIGALIWWIVILTSGAKVFWLLGSMV